MFEGSEYSVGRRWAWLATAAVLVAGAAQAQTTYAVSLNSGGLEPALLGLASQTRQQIMFSKGVVAGLRAPAVKGQMTPEQALERLLAGTDLRARRVNASVVVVERLATGGLGDPASRPFVAEAGDGPATIQGEQGVSEPRLPPTTIDELTVTGSNIRGARSASPLLVVGRADLERSGHATVAAALAALPQAFGGGASEGTMNTGADTVRRNVTYGTGINLRGLGADATLVLINGRRLAGSGSFGDFSDISGIPTAAVERVEILLDGASAIYGADAVGGVVNIILRKRFEGAESRLYSGVGVAGEPYQVQVSQTLGHDWGSGGVVLSYEYQKREALRDIDRPFTANADLRSLGGSDRRTTTSFPGNILRIDPATGASAPGWAIPMGQNGVGLRPQDLPAGVINRQNQRQGTDTLPRQTLQSAYLAVQQDLGARLQLNGDIRYSFRKAGVRLPAPTTTLTVNRSNPYFVSPNGSSSHNISYSFAGDLPNPFLVASSETWAATFGGTLKLTGDWQADGYLGWGQELAETRTGGSVNTLFLREALGTIADRPDTAYSAARDGYFNPFNGIAGANDPDTLAFIAQGFGATRVRVRSSVASAQADGSLFDLPGGPLKLAFGGQARKESLRRAGANFATTATPVPQESGYVTRETLSGFAELRAPLVGPATARPGLERLELSLAGRVERYDDVGTTSNPKVGIHWSPVSGLELRGTYGRSFRAPALREVNDPPVNTQSLLPLASGANVRVLLLQGGNPSLKPETARSWTLGFDLQPASVPGLTLSATGFDIAFHNRIDRPVLQNSIVALYDPTFASFVQFISPRTNAADLAQITSLIESPAFDPSLGVFPATDYAAIVDIRYVNTTTVRVRGVDVQASYRFDLGADQIAIGGNATWMADFKQRVTPTSDVVQRVGRAGFPVKLRGRVTADWTHDQVTAGVAVNYIAGYRDARDVRIAAQTTVDLQLRWAGARGWTKDWDILFGLRNAFDKGPAFYDNASGVGYDPTNADPIGRFVSVQLTRRW